MKIKTKYTAGFSLVELLVVMGMLGILSASAFAGYKSLQKNSYNQQVENDLRSLQNILEQYKKDHHGLYPLPQPGGSVNVLCFDRNFILTHDCQLAAIRQGLITDALLDSQNIPRNPHSGTHYAYGVTGDAKHYQIAGLVTGKDQAWVAKVVGSLQPSGAFHYPGLIRAYNGAMVVRDNGEALPTSPHKKFAASLNVIAGTVSTFNEKGKPMNVGEALGVGCRMVVEKGGLAEIYWPDGSISFLGSKQDQTALELLPSSILNEDQSSRIHLKVVTGRVWNKVVRLAQKSEFEIETTAAIGGVRGTEFGMDASTHTLFVTSGSVWIGSNSEENMVEVSVNETPKQATMTANGPEDIKAIEEQELLDYVDSMLTNKQISDSQRPYLIKATAHPNQSVYDVFVSFNGLKTAKLMLDGFQIFGVSQTSGYRTMKEGSLNHPLLEVKTVEYLQEEGLYRFEIDYFSQANNPLWNKNKFESILVRAFAEDESGKRHYSDISWPPLGLLSSAQEDKTFSFLNDHLYPELMGLTINKPPTTLVDICESNEGLWKENSCWIMGEPGQSCSDACSDFGAENQVYGGSVCTEGNWNDDENCSICQTFNPGSQCISLNAEYAPIHRPNPFSRCYYRINSALTCELSEQAPTRRLCQCH